MPLAAVAALAAGTGCAAGERAGQDGTAAAAVDPALQSMVDSLLPTLQRLSGLHLVHPVQMALQDTAEVRAYVARQLDRDLPPDVLDGLRSTYATLGLMADSLQLRPLLLDLYTEQIVGYYDPASKRLYVVRGVSRDALEPVLAHELVHALQDQHTNLDSLISRDRGNDRQEAAQAAIEGHATLVMFAYLAERTTGHAVRPGALPNPAPDLRAGWEAQSAQFPVFRRAPRIIKETLLFPYVEGANFVHALWQTRATDSVGVAPLDSLLPQSTEEVLDPQARFLARRDQPTELRFSSPATWPVAYENTLGEFETGVFLAHYLGDEGQGMARGWDGDRFRLLRTPRGGFALVWYSVWDDTIAADRFVEAIRRVEAARSTRRAAIVRQTVAGRPVVKIVDVPAGEAPRDVPAATISIEANDRGTPPPG